LLFLKRYIIVLKALFLDENIIEENTIICQNHQIIISGA
jgi:hypothetical protein